MAGKTRHNYIVVIGSCCTADAIRPKDLDDIRGAKLRLLWYQGRTSLLSMRTAGLEPEEFAFRGEREGEKGVNWGLTMVVDEARKRHQERLLGVIGMGDAVVLDVVSAFCFPHLVVEPEERLFLQSKEWEQYITLSAQAERRWLWEMPIERSRRALREVLEPLYERQPELCLVFHLPRPCFNDGVFFPEPAVAAEVDFYHRYGEALYEEASRCFPRVSVASCGGESADPDHPTGAFPFHYHEAYRIGLRQELERLLELPDEPQATAAERAGEAGKEAAVSP